jgi:hypothetical protein
MMRIFITAALIAGLAIPAAAVAESGWMGIGRREVSDSVERDAIRARGDAQFRQIMICVEQAPVRFQDVTVRYRNGATQDVRLRSLVRAGGCTRFIDLRGRQRDIEAVDFTYEAASLGRERARVELYAR